MESIDKFIDGHADLFFIIAIIEAFIIIFLIVYILFRRWDEDTDRNIRTFRSDSVNGNSNDVARWRDQCNALNRELTDLKNDLRRGRIYKNDQDLLSNQLNNSRTIVPPIEHTPPSYNTYDDYAAGERAKGIYVNQTTNDDGTVKSEVIFAHTDDEPLPVYSSLKYEYLEAANGGQFRKLLPSDEKCFFRTWEEKGTRKFEFHGNVDKALANINAIFDDVCEIEGKQNGATNIINVEPGILDNKLKVEKPAKIQLT